MNHLLKPINVLDRFQSLILTSARNFTKTEPLRFEAGPRKMTRCRVVDNSNLGKQAMLEGKPPKIIHVYNKTGVAVIGDKVLVAIKGLKKRAYVVGVKMRQLGHNVPKLDTNNIVLLDDHGNPLGTRVLVPIPSLLRGRKELSKICAIATKFV